jgi:MinD-like ATPase involved in chromosome partitioning or flagellar assembly
VLLPLSQNVLDSERYGTRHRAAIGISEQSDAIIVVVSEETGSISLVMRGRIERNLTEEQLRRRILNLIRPQAPRRTAALLRRSTEGRWGVDAVGEPEQPIDPEARVVNPEPDVVAEPEVLPAETAAPIEAAKAVKTAKPIQPVRSQAAAPGQRRR